MFFLFITVLLLTGCSSQKELTVEKYFSSCVYISTRDISFKGDFFRDKNGNISLIVTSPDSVKGYEYEVNDDEVQMIYQGIESNYLITDFPHNAPIRIIYQVFSNFDSSLSHLKRDKENYKMKSGDYTVRINNQGYVDSIANDNTHITFVGAKPLKNEAEN